MKEKQYKERCIERLLLATSWALTHSDYIYYWVCTKTITMTITKYSTIDIQAHQLKRRNFRKVLLQPIATFYFIKNLFFFIFILE
jgi:hypothetical protein